MADDFSILESTAKNIASSPLLGLISSIQQLAKGQSAIQTAIAALTTAINTKFPDWVAVPANSASAGIAGQVAYDGAGHFYLCYATNSWLKFTGAAF